MSGPGALGARRSLCRGPALCVSGPTAPCVGARCSLSSVGVGATTPFLCHIPAVCVSGPSTFRRGLCRGPAVLPALFLSGPRGPALFVSGPRRPALLLCVGARRSVSGPGALCVGAQRSVCRGPALFVSAGSVCRGPALSVSGPGALRRSVCVGTRRSVSASRVSLFLSGFGGLYPALFARADRCWMGDADGSWVRSTRSQLPTQAQLPSACHPSGRGPPAPIRMQPGAFPFSTCLGKKPQVGCREALVMLRTPTWQNLAKAQDPTQVGLHWFRTICLIMTNKRPVSSALSGWLAEARKSPIMRGAATLSSQAPGAC